MTSIQASINQALSLAQSLALRTRHGIEQAEAKEIKEAKETERARKALKKEQDQKRTSKKHISSTLLKDSAKGDKKWAITMLRS